jgi:transcriptional regulator with XRE-family HTH domain
MSILYKNIAALCEEKGIKGAKMCTDIGMSKGILTDLKMGRRAGVNAVTAQKIASYFGVSVGYLLGEEEKDQCRPNCENKEKPTVNDDELSENLQKLIDFAMSVPEDKQELALRLLRTIVEDDQ